MNLPLEGIKVLDLTRILTGPFATMKLADMGADVIKVEQPGSGDDTRSYGPPFIEGHAAYFLSINRNKRSITLNLKSEKGKEILRKLISWCDVMIENFRPGTIERLGFSYDEVKKINPRVIYCSISGFGQVGAMRDKPSYDLLVQGESGLMDITGQSDGPPTKVGFSLADVNGGLAAVEGILLALFQREKTGEGQRIDISMLDALLALFTYQTQIYLMTGKEPKRKGNLHPTITPYQTYQAKDGFFNMAIASEVQWGRLLELFGEEFPAKEVEPLHTDAFATNADRVVNREKLNEILCPLFLQRTTDEWVNLLDSKGLARGRINSVKQICDSQLLKDREMILSTIHPDVGEMKVVGNPVKMSGSKTGIRRPPPKLGEHTKEVLASLGYKLDEIEGMVGTDVL